jgi:hypothetical protein
MSAGKACRVGSGPPNESRRFALMPHARTVGVPPTRACWRQAQQRRPERGFQPRADRRIRSSSRRRRLLGRPSPRTALIPGAITRTDRRWAVVDVAQGGGRRADASFDRSHDLDDPLAFGDQGMHDVAGANLRRRFCRVAVDADVPAVAQLGRDGPGLDEAHRAQPAIDPRVFGHVLPCTCSSHDLTIGMAAPAEGSASGSSSKGSDDSRPGLQSKIRRPRPQLGINHDVA